MLWISGHCGASGNKRCDRITNKTEKFQPRPNFNMALNFYKKQIEGKQKPRVAECLEEKPNRITPVLNIPGTEWLQVVQWAQQKTTNLCCMSQNWTPSYGILSVLL